MSKYSESQLESFFEDVTTYIEEAYDKKVWEFLRLLEAMDKNLDRDEIIIKYQKHFKGYGFYGQE